MTRPRRPSPRADAVPLASGRSRPGLRTAPAEAAAPPPTRIGGPGSLRIVGGRLRGRRLVVPGGAGLRPTGERARESLFNVLLHRFQGRDGFSLIGARVLDVFAGTGALGLEALSRGAARVVFLENDRDSLAALAVNVAACEARGQTCILHSDARRPPRVAGNEGAADLAFLDPPYDAPLASETLVALVAAGWLAPRALVCVETNATRPAPAWPEGFVLLDERRSGKARLTILRRDPSRIRPTAIPSAEVSTPASPPSAPPQASGPTVPIEPA